MELVRKAISRNGIVYLKYVLYTYPKYVLYTYPKS